MHPDMARSLCTDFGILLSIVLCLRDQRRGGGTGTAIRYAAGGPRTGMAGLGRDGHEQTRRGEVRRCEAIGNNWTWT